MILYFHRTCGQRNLVVLTEQQIVVNLFINTLTTSFTVNTPIFNFFDVILSLQIDTFTKMNEENRRRNRPKEETERLLQYYINKYDSGALSRLNYVKKVSLKFLPDPLKTV